MLDEAKAGRDEMHAQIRATAAQHDKESAEYRNRQDELNTEVDNLNGVIEEERQRAARTLQAHLEECDALKQDHHNDKLKYQKEIEEM